LHPDHDFRHCIAAPPFGELASKSKRLSTEGVGKRVEQVSYKGSLSSDVGLLLSEHRLAVNSSGNPSGHKSSRGWRRDRAMEGEEEQS
jgi:hypothetical protein